jgi:hypothetical protein
MTVKSAAKSYFSHAIVKPFVCGALSAVGDHVVMKNNDLKGCAMFGAAVGAGVFAASNVEQVASSFFPTATSIGRIAGVERFVEGRVVEIICGSGAGLLFQKFVLGNVDYNMQNWAMRAAIIAGADIAGDTICTLMMIV